MSNHGNEKHNSDLAWRTLTDFTLPTVAGSAREVIDRVAKATLELRLSSTRQEELEAALVEAVIKAIPTIPDGRPELPARVRVLVLDFRPAVIGDVAERPRETAPLPETRDLEGNPSPPKLSAGWGFFLVERIADNLDTGDGSARYMVDLFIYPEAE